MNKLMTFLLCFSLSYAGKRRIGGSMYMLNFQEALSDCAGFKNAAINAHRLTLLVDDESQSTYLNGDIRISQKITEDALVTLTVYRETELRRELFYVLEGVLCDRIHDENMPYYPLFQAMGIDKCPIEAKVYEIDRLALNLDHAGDLMSNEYVADYMAELLIEKKGGGLELQAEKMCCYEMSLSVLEVKYQEE